MICNSNANGALPEMSPAFVVNPPWPKTKERSSRQAPRSIHPPNITGKAGRKICYKSMHAHTGTCPRAVIETARSHNSTSFYFPLLLSSLARPPEGFRNLLARPHGNMSARCHRNCAESYFNVFWCFVTPRVRKPTWAPGTSP